MILSQILIHQNNLNHRPNLEEPNKKKILLIDDEEGLRKALKRLLLLDGFTVIDAGDGHSALQALASFTPDVILSDVRMPGIHGSDLLKEFKKRMKHTPVIFITGHGDPDLALHLLNHGADRVLQKPISYLEILKAVSNAIRTHFAPEFVDISPTPSRSLNGMNQS